MKIIKLGLLGLTLFVYGSVSAQTINTPYSNHQLGEFLFQGLSHNYATGQVGIGMPTPWHINLQNPALLTYNSFSSFQVALQSDFRNYRSELDESKAQSGSLRFLAMSFPVVANRWTSAFAVLPLTTMNYSTQSYSLIDEQDSVLQSINNRGEGGLTQVQWANGIRLYKGLTVGFKGSYIFGTLEKASNISLSSPKVSTANYVVSYYDMSRYSDLNLSLGLSYQAKLGEKNIVTMGLVHGLSKKIEGTIDFGRERQTPAGITLSDTLLIADEYIDFDLPKSYEFGISYEKLNKLRVGLDISFHDWESTQNSESATVRNTLSIATGMEIIPDYTSVSSYLKRTSYRFGVNLRQLPYLENNTEINDFGINFGAAFPVSGYSSMDVAFKYGFRGTTDNSLIEERYFQVVIGATINDRWFQKRRYD